MTWFIKDQRQQCPLRRRHVFRIGFVGLATIALATLATGANAYASPALSAPAYSTQAVHTTHARPPRSSTSSSPTVNGDNGGSFGLLPARSSSSSALSTTPQVSTNSCSGWWVNSVASVVFQETNLGGTARAVAWGFFLSNQARSYLGPVVTVSMPFTYVNGVGINSSYAPHTENVAYNFHASLSRYVILGAFHPTLIQLQAGDTLTLYWLLNSASQSGHGAYRYITCRV